MILWLTGNSRAGKTTLSKRLVTLLKKTLDTDNVVQLDGDEVRKIWPGFSFTKEDREENNLRVARLASYLESQGFVIVVSVICPFSKLREKVKQICNCTFVYVKGGKTPSKKYPYEAPVGCLVYEKEVK